MLIHIGQFELHKVSGTYRLLTGVANRPSIGFNTEWSAFVNKIGNYDYDEQEHVVWSHFSVNKRERSIVQIEYLTILVRFFSCNPTFFAFFHVGNKWGAAARARWLVRSSVLQSCVEALTARPAAVARRRRRDNFTVLQIEIFAELAADSWLVERPAGGGSKQPFMVALMGGGPCSGGRGGGRWGVVANNFLLVPPALHATTETGNLL